MHCLYQRSICGRSIGGILSYYCISGLILRVFRTEANETHVDVGGPVTPEVILRYLSNELRRCHIKPNMPLQTTSLQTLHSIASLLTHVPIIEIRELSSDCCQSLRLSRRSLLVWSSNQHYPLYLKIWRLREKSKSIDLYKISALSNIFIMWRQICFNSLPRCHTSSHIVTNDWWFNVKHHYNQPPSTVEKFVFISETLVGDHTMLDDYNTVREKTTASSGAT